MRSRRREEGAAAVEMAIVLPILVLILGGIIDFGFAFNGQISLTHAAREGARAEAISPGDGESVALDRFQAPAMTNPQSMVTLACGASGDDTEVRIWADYEWFILPFADRTFQGRAVMRCGG